MDEIIANDPAAVARLMDAVESAAEVDVTAFARLVGRGETTVLKAWRNGQLPSVGGGKMPVREGLVAMVSCGGLRRDRKPIPDFIIRAEARARELLGLPPREDSSPTDSPRAEVDEWRLKYLKAQTAARTAAAQATALRNDVEKGRLVLRAEVELDASECATAIAGALFRLPERVAGMCVGCTADEIAEILRREISRALEAIQASAFTGDWSGVL